MVVWITVGLAVLCLLYYIVIVIYSGFSTAFAAFWLLASGFFALVAAGARYAQLHPKKLPLWVPVSVATFCAASLTIFCIVEVLVFFGAASEGTPNLDYVIVLGAKVRDDSLSKSLVKRLDKAIEYSQQNPDTILVLSGGKGADEPVYEAQAMYDYLLYNGVPSKQMVMETISTSTVENIAYSKVLIDKLEEEEEAVQKSQVAPGPYSIVEKKPIQIGVITSDFHVYRAKKIGQKWGIPEIYGIAADSDPVLFLHLCVRECLAILKDKLMGNM